MEKDRLFGTDGIREHVGSFSMRPDQIVKLGSILAVLARKRTGTSCVVIGRDTRASGAYLEHALIAGLAAYGVDCHLLGILPTAGVAYHTKRSSASLGIMISASHNPYHDNGFKLFDETGFKVSEEIEHFIEQQYFKASFPNEIAKKPGKIFLHENAAKEYYWFNKNRLPKDFSLSGLKLVIDCANGAASTIAPYIFADLGCEISLIGSSLAGDDINEDFGTMAPKRLMAEVANKRAHLGIGFDGDADRVLFVDENGQIIDGDAVIATMAIALKKSGALKNDTVVATVMSGMALDNALGPHGIKVARSPVGDKYVAQKMLSGGFSFGGENSGHLIQFPHQTTGDGIFAAIEFLRILKNEGCPVSQLISFYQPIPSLLKNIDVQRKIPLGDLPNTQAALGKANDYLKNQGRALLRYSGTENKARLLVEASNEADCQRIAEDISYTFGEELNAAPEQIQ